MKDTNIADPDTEAARLLKVRTDELLNPKDTRKLLKTSLQKRLDKYKEEIKRLKEDKVSYNKIIEMIEEVSTEVGSPLIVSTQAIRSYCENILGFKPTPRPRKNKNIDGKES